MLKMKDMFKEDQFGMYLGNGIVMAKKGGGAAPAPIFTAPPAAPAVTEAATQASAVTPEEELARKKEATKSGAKSLQIPITGANAGVSTVGTGTASTTA